MIQFLHLSFADDLSRADYTNIAMQCLSDAEQRTVVILPDRMHVLTLKTERDPLELAMAVDAVVRVAEYMVEADDDAHTLITHVTNPVDPTLH